MLHRAAALLAMFFGLLGVIGCFLGMYTIWLTGIRLDRANDKIFAVVDRSLAGAGERVVGVQQRIQEARLTTDEIGKLVRDWTGKLVAERAVSLLEIQVKMGRLGQKLEQADLWLETSNDSIQSAQQILETVNSIGAPLNADMVEDAVEKLASLRTKVQEARETIGDIREFVAKFGDVTSPVGQTTHLIRVVARVTVTVVDIDSRLGEVANQLSELQARAGQLKDRTSNYIVRATVVGVLLCAWMATGQVTLCLYGWQTCRQKREGVKASGSSPSQPPAA
jgi:hypothetical protein